jgi:hypothetical protein
MASLTPFQLRAAALNKRYGLPTSTEAPAPTEPVKNRVWLAARTVTTRFDSRLFVYALIENDLYGTRGFPHSLTLPQNSKVADEYAQALNFALKGLPREEKTALHTDLPVLIDLSEFQDLEVIPSSDNPATPYLERFILDSSYR